VKNPAAYRAQNAVNNAVRDGKLKKEPCAICAASKVHAHHKDYSKPLEVVWLCARCHHRLHAIFPELEGKKKSNENA
jgi:ribosomal protein S27AE